MYVIFSSILKTSTYLNETRLNDIRDSIKELFSLSQPLERYVTASQEDQTETCGKQYNPIFTRLRPNTHCRLVACNSVARRHKT